MNQAPMNIKDALINPLLGSGLVFCFLSVSYFVRILFTFQATRGFI